MLKAIWRDPGVWIAPGVSLVFIVAGFFMHSGFLKILKNGSSEPSVSSAGQAQPLPANPPLESHE
ncbi:hypothetical protein [Polaromonas sp. CG9_12]|uniref:hypothetical protein n=1 Tax=Polaromonas sp. CG_9.11 TaxID=2787730 RepID=UPI0004DDD6B2|nr:hypothetical protein [Polaromonas sp. CG9_12]